MTEKEGGQELKANADETDGFLLPAVEREGNYINNFLKFAFSMSFTKILNINKPE